MSPLTHQCVTFAEPDFPLIAFTERQQLKIRDDFACRNAMCLQRIDDTPQHGAVDHRHRHTAVVLGVCEGKMQVLDVVRQLFLEGKGHGGEAPASTGHRRVRERHHRRTQRHEHTATGCRHRGITKQTGLDRR